MTKKIEMRVVDSRTFDAGDPPVSVTVALLVPVNEEAAPSAIGAPGNAQVASASPVPLNKGVRVDGTLTVTIVDDADEAKRYSHGSRHSIGGESGDARGEPTQQGR